MVGFLTSTPGCFNGHGKDTAVGTHDDNDSLDVESWPEQDSKYVNIPVFSLPEHVN